MDGTIQCKKITLILYGSDNDIVMNVQLLRSEAWVQQMDVKKDEFMFLSLQEKDIHDWFYVEDIQPFTISSDEGDGNLVKGMFRSFDEVLKINFDSGESFECTHGHRFYSLDDNDWKPAGDLRIDERILSKDGGFVTIESIKPQLAIHEVFNLEVSDNHTYCVTSDNIVSHNTDLCGKGNRIITKLKNSLKYRRPLSTELQKLWSDPLYIIQTGRNYEMSVLMFKHTNVLENRIVELSRDSALKAVMPPAGYRLYSKSIPDAFNRAGPDIWFRKIQNRQPSYYLREVKVMDDVIGMTPVGQLLKGFRQFRRSAGTSATIDHMELFVQFPLSASDGSIITRSTVDFLLKDFRSKIRNPGEHLSQKMSIRFIDGHGQEICHEPIF